MNFYTTKQPHRGFVEAMSPEVYFRCIPEPELVRFPLIILTFVPNMMLLAPFITKQHPTKGCGTGAQGCILGMFHYSSIFIANTELRIKLMLSTHIT